MGIFFRLMKPEDIKIDPEFKDLLCPLSEYEERALEGSLLSQGCLSPLIVEEKLGVLIDGHNRLRLCKKNSIPFEVKSIMLGGRETAEKWIIRNQLGRRNLTEKQMEAYIVQIYRVAKKKAGFQPGESGNPSGVKQRAHFERAAKKSETAKKIGEQVGKSQATVRRLDKKHEKIEKAGKIKEYLEDKLPKAEVKKILEAEKPMRKQTKAEAQEEAELIAENPQIFEEAKPQDAKKEKPNNINPIIETIKAANLTKQEIKSLIQFLKSL